MKGPEENIVEDLPAVSGPRGLLKEKVREKRFEALSNPKHKIEGLKLSPHTHHYHQPHTVTVEPWTKLKHTRRTKCILTWFAVQRLIV